MTDQELETLKRWSKQLEEITIAIDHLNAKEVIARETLNSIASWDEGKTVTPGFDEPCAAQEARNALAMMDEVMTKGVV